MVTLERDKRQPREMVKLGRVEGNNGNFGTVGDPKFMKKCWNVLVLGENILSSPYTFHH